MVQAYCGAGAQYSLDSFAHDDRSKTWRTHKVLRTSSQKTLISSWSKEPLFSKRVSAVLTPNKTYGDMKINV